MTIKGSIKEGAGFLKEEFNEKTGDRTDAREGRALRNEGRLENGKMPKISEPGTGH